MLQTLKTWLTRLFPGSIPDLYREMHARGSFPGVTWQAHAEALRKTVPEIEQLRILDFGCGPLGGLTQAFAHVTSYDPFIEKYAADPWDRPYDLIFSSDVLEHLTIKQADDFLDRIVAAAPSFVFLNISTRLAYKTLPNGANAHLTVKPPEWWLSHLKRRLAGYEPILAQADLLRADVTYCFQRLTPGPPSPPQSLP